MHPSLLPWKLCSFSSSFTQNILCLYFSSLLAHFFLHIRGPLCLICTLHPHFHDCAHACPCFCKHLWIGWRTVQRHVHCKAYCMMTTSTANRLVGSCRWASTNGGSSQMMREQKGCSTMETAKGALGERRPLVAPYAYVYSCLHEWVPFFYQPDKTFNANSLKIPVHSTQLLGCLLVQDISQ